MAQGSLGPHYIKWWICVTIMKAIIVIILLNLINFYEHFVIYVYTVYCVSEVTDIADLLEAPTFTKILITHTLRNLILCIIPSKVLLQCIQGTTLSIYFNLVLY